MNNVDDGIEVWGGTVNLKYFAIWNIGDDSLDVDQGWRGKAQFGLIVQGYSADAAQGSGVGDNVFECDGAENSDWQPVTTSTIYNCTVIGQPADGDHGMAFRDNARVQFRNCVFMNVGERVVSFDNVDGDGGSGYGHNGTLSWANTWTTPYTATSTVNAPANPALFYTVQTSGNLIEVKDSVFYGNPHASAYTEANARGVFAVGNNNVQEPANMPIQSITRAAPVVKGGKVMQRVTFLDPRPAADALTSVAAAPNDGFFTPAQYRGAFAPGQRGMWLCGWTASEAFGLTPKVYTYEITQDGPGGIIRVTNACGTPSNVYFNPITLNAGVFPAGWLAGVDMPIADLFFQLSSSAPFLGLLDANGGAVFEIPGGALPAGITFYTASFEFAGAGAVSTMQGASFTTL
jgi:hypothetical protein